MNRTEILRLATLASKESRTFQQTTEIAELGEKAKNDFRDAFPITNVSRLDLPSHIDRDKVSDEDMQEIADKMSDAYMNVFWIDLKCITEWMDLPLVTEEEEVEDGD